MSCVLSPIQIHFPEKDKVLERVRGRHLGGKIAFCFPKESERQDGKAEQLFCIPLNIGGVGGGSVVVDVGGRDSLLVVSCGPWIVRS